MAYVFVSASDQGGASGGALTVTKPAGALDGHIARVDAYLEDDTNTWASVGAGFTSITNVLNTGGSSLWRHEVWWKVLSGEPASWTWTPTTNGWRRVSVTVYSGGVSPAVDAFSSASGDGVAIGSQLAPSVTTTETDDLLICAYQNWDFQTPTGGMSGAAVNTRVNSDWMISDATIAAIGATGTTGPAGTPVGTEDYSIMHTAFKLGGVIYEQEGSRFRNDDGGESGATWRQNQDTNDSIALSTLFRLRVLVNTTGDSPAVHYKLKYREVGDDTWLDVP